MDLIVNIPNRVFPLYPIARFKITLELTAIPTGSTLAVFGSGPIPLGTAAFFSGNYVQFKSGSGNSVVIDITLRSDFNAGDYTALKATAPQRPYPITLTFTPPGVATISGYRLSSYCAPSSQAKTCTSRRVNTSPVTWNTAPPLPSIDMGRHALDVILVLDRSGSMGDPVPAGLQGSTGEIKMDVLKWAVAQFIDAWKQEVTGVPDDRLAVVWFSTTAAAMAGGFKRRDLAGGWDAIKTAVNAETANGWTALGDGLSVAFDIWDDDLGHNDGAVVLMTNGMQNIGNQVILDPNPTGDPTKLAFFDFNATPPAYVSIASKCIPVQTIGVGAPAGVPTDTLNTISTQTGGKTDLTAGSTMDFAFLAQLVEVLKGNTLSIRSQFVDTLPKGQVSSVPTPFEVGPWVRQVIAILAWRGVRYGLRLNLFPPGSSQGMVTEGVNDAYYQIQAIDADTIANYPGEWQAIVSRSEAISTIEYHLTLLYVEASLAYSLYFDNQDPTPGEPIILRVDLSLEGLPLPNLSSNSLKVEVFGPSGALGTILHNNNVSDDVLQNNPPGADPDTFNTPAERKIFYMIENNKLGDQITPQLLTQGFLLDDGKPSSGDQVAGDGTYSFRYENTKLPGLYIFHVTMDMDTPQTGKIQRIEERKLEVRIQQLAESSLTVTKSEEPGNYVINVIPVDPYGNYLGPDHNSRLDLQVTGGGQLNLPLVDLRAFGTYTAMLTQVPTGSDPIVSLKYEGKVVREGPLSKLAGGGCLQMIVEFVKKLFGL